MANGTDSDEFVERSRGRQGLKRELSFALSQVDVCCSLGRTRARKPQIEAPENLNPKRMKKAKKTEAHKDEDKRVEDLVEAVSEDDAKSDVVDLMSDEEPRSHVAESVVKEEVTGEELKNGVVEMDVDNEQNVGAVGDGDEDRQEQLKKNEPEKPDSVEGEVIAVEKPIVRYSRLAKRRKSQVVVESKLAEKVSGDKAKNDAVDMAVGNGPNAGCGDELGKEDEAKQEKLKEDEGKLEEPKKSESEQEEPKKSESEQEEPKKSESEQPLVKLDILNLIKKGDKAEGEVSEKPLRRYSRSALKLKSRQVAADELKNVAANMAVDDEPKAGGVGDSVTEDEPKQEELNTSLVKLDILDLIEKSDKTESEVSEKPQRRFTRSSLNAENEALDSVSQKSSSVEVEMEMSKTAKKFKLSELLETGILEGQPVTYCKVSKGKTPAEKGLTGVINGSHILCYCERCNGTDAVSPATFELHADSTNKRPLEYIYLENGNTLWDVLTACDSSLETLEEAVLLAVGCSSIKTCTICLNCKGSMCQDETRPAMLLCGSCLELKETQAKLSVAEKGSEGANNSSELPKLVSVATSPNTVTKSPDTIPEFTDIISRCHETDSKFSGTISENPGSSSKCPDAVLKSRSSASKSRGRVTKKDLGMHKLVFEEDVLEDGTELSYIHNGKILAFGYKKGSGIVCKCHDQEVSPSQFESHAGCSSRRKPYHNIFMSNGMSLHQLALELSKNRKFTTKDSDDLCQICKKGGKFICCNSCPRVYHTGCLSLPTVPNGSWYCNHCQTMFDKQKDMDNHVNAVAAGRVPGVDPMEQITNRCIRIVTACDEKFGGCSLCSGHEFKNEGFGPGTVILCDQCEREFHIGCLKEKGIVDLKEVPKEKWFCHPACLRNYSALQKLVIHGQQKLPDSLLNIINQKHSGKDPANGGLDVKWRVLSGKTATSDESLELLKKALAIFHDQFAPIIDKETGRDFIREMLYGGAIKTQEFGGMHCAIITVNESVVSAAMFRIYGTDVAELPLVATSADCQGQGYFQTLFSCIERFLAFLYVKVLLLPAAAEAASIWTKKFGFQNLNQSEIYEYRKQYPILIFDGTSVLKKSVPKCRLAKDKVKAKTNVESS